MGPLKPGGCLRGVPPGLHQIINVLAKGGIRQHRLEFLSRDRLQDDPGVVRDIPQHRIQHPPHLVGGMIP